MSQKVKGYSTFWSTAIRIVTIDAVSGPKCGNNLIIVTSLQTHTEDGKIPAFCYLFRILTTRLELRIEEKVAIRGFDH